MKALKKFRSWVYGYGSLKVDDSTSVVQLNRSATDLPGALVTRWLAWSRLCDFFVKHVPGSKHGGPDGLSRRPKAPEELQEEADFDDAIAVKLEGVKAQTLKVTGITHGRRMLAILYSEESKRIAGYLVTLARPDGKTTMEWKSFRREAFKFVVGDDHLYRR